MVFSLDLSQRGKEIFVNFMVMFYIAVSGLLMALVYFIMATIETAFLSVDCLIPQNVFVSTCQEWFTLALYPVLVLKEVFIYANYFLIFGLVFGLFYMGFKTKKHPVLLVVHIVISLIIGYLSIEIANIYRTLIGNEIIYNMLIPFPIYNKIMIYFPQFIFFVILASGAIGFMGVFKSINQYNQGAEDLINA